MSESETEQASGVAENERASEREARFEEKFAEPSSADEVSFHVPRD